MKPRDCSRQWEAEALEDGRLEGPDREGFERHLTACAACRRELAELESLRQTMTAASGPEPSLFERHRLRGALLREANRQRLRPQRRKRWVIALAVFAALAALAGAVFMLRPMAPRAPVPVASSPAPPDFHVTGDGAVTKTRSLGPTAVVELAEGEASIEVAHLTPAQRFLVLLPDGEIEVRGTKFTVAVESGHTQRVVVTDGKVILRRAGQADSILGAGDRWDGPVAEVPDLAPRGPAAGLAPRASASSPRRASAGERFEQAMASFHAGRYAQADADLAAFADAFPHDSRREDVAFLRAVARSRMGDRAGAAALAQTYLRDYPSGLRRVEAQHLIDGAAP